LSLRLPGWFALRFAARTFLALLFQEPPRITRFAPISTFAAEPPSYHASTGGRRVISAERHALASACAVIPSADA
jgi:hypothetical protein